MRYSRSRTRELGITMVAILNPPRTAAKPRTNRVPSKTRPPLLRATLADLQDRLGHIPEERILMDPPPGTATEQDVIYLDDHEDRICELVEGVLVEKPMGFEESSLAAMIIQ